MDTTQPSLKNASKISLVALGILLVAAFVYYKERLFFADSSFIVFNIINYKGLCIQEHRYGSFITQLVPFLGEKLHLPIKTLLLGYAVSFNFLYLAVAALLVFLFKQYRLAIIMAMYFFLFVSDSFFWLNNELHQGIVWMFLLFAVTHHLGDKKANIFLLVGSFILLAFLAISSHFIVIIPTVFLWVYFIIEKKYWPFSIKRTVLLSFLLIAMVVFKFLIGNAHSYDDNDLHGVTHVSIEDMYMSFTKPVVLMFLYRCLTNYWLAIIILAISMVCLAKSNKKILIAWVVISCVGYLMLMGLAFGNTDRDFLLCHIENEWESIGIIVSVPFVFVFLPKVKPQTSVLILSLIFITRLIYISTAIHEFTWRTYFKEQVMAQMKKKGITKLALYMDDYRKPKLLLDWALPYETIMTSALEGDKPQITFCYVNKDDKATLEMIKDQGFYDKWTMQPATSLNPTYFSIDTTQPYQVMTYEDLMKE